MNLNRQSVRKTLVLLSSLLFPICIDVCPKDAIHYRIFHQRKEGSVHH